MITQCPKTGRTCEVTGCNGCWKDSTTQDEIIRMAREAGFVFPEMQEDSFTCWWEELERFAALVAAHEREACAKVCDAEVAYYKSDDLHFAVERAAAAIRARGNNK